MFEGSSRSISESSVRMFFSTHLHVFYLENLLSSLDFRLILLSPYNLSWYLRVCTNYNEEWMSNEWTGMFIIPYGRPSATYLHYVFLLKILINVWSPWYTSLTRLSFTSSIPLFGLPSGYPADTMHTSWLAKKLDLANSSWSNRYSTSWGHWNLPPQLIRTKRCFFHSSCLMKYVKRSIPEGH